jgi:hypothetical protein
MCFGHESQPTENTRASERAPVLGTNGNTVYGRIDEFELTPTPFGSTTTVLNDWSSNRVRCCVHSLLAGRTLHAGREDGRERILIIEAGDASLGAAGSSQGLKPLDALRSGPDSNFEISASSEVRILEVSMATSTTPRARRASVEIQRRNDTDWKLYEYEALGQEVFVPDYEGAIGLLRFIFPQDEIPVHVHPASGRIIRPISGRGYTYMHPDRCPMDNRTIAAFDANVIHTNGPLKGQNYQLWALQLPWIPSGIDTQNIAGFESFVRYVADVPEPAQRKTLDGLLERVRSQPG